MWLSHWKLTRDPFATNAAPYVATPTHEEAVARVVHAIESCQRSAVVRADAGLGKSFLLNRALAETRGPSRRVAHASGPLDGASLFTALAESLGTRVSAGASRATAWRALAQAVRLERWQRSHVILVVDDVHLLTTSDDRSDLERLAHLESSPTARFTVVTAGRPPDERLPVAAPWDLTIRLSPLTRTEAEQFVVAKLALAGRTEPTFTPRALTRLHAGAEGIPRGLDRLGSLALMAGAMRGLEIITPDVIDGVTRECALPAA